MGEKLTFRRNIKIPKALSCDKNLMKRIDNYCDNKEIKLAKFLEKMDEKLIKLKTNSIDLTKKLNDLPQSKIIIRDLDNIIDRNCLNIQRHKYSEALREVIEEELNQNG